NGGGPVDPYGWSGSYPDPWTKDAGNLWLGGSPPFAPIQMPNVTVNAASRLGNPTAVDVSWSSPGNMSFTVFVVSPSGVRSAWTTSSGSSSATFQGAPAGGGAARARGPVEPRVPAAQGGDRGGSLHEARPRQARRGRDRPRPRRAWADRCRSRAAAIVRRRHPLGGCRGVRQSGR